MKAFRTWKLRLFEVSKGFAECQIIRERMWKGSDLKPPSSQSCRQGRKGKPCEADCTCTDEAPTFYGKRNLPTFAVCASETVLHGKLATCSCSVPCWNSLTATEPHRAPLAAAVPVSTRSELKQKPITSIVPIPIIVVIPERRTGPHVAQSA